MRTFKSQNGHQTYSLSFGKKMDTAIKSFSKVWIHWTTKTAFSKPERARVNQVLSFSSALTNDLSSKRWLTLISKLSRESKSRISNVSARIIGVFWLGFMVFTQSRWRTKNQLNWSSWATRWREGETVVSLGSLTWRAQW